MKTIYSPQSIEKDCLTQWTTPNYFSPKTMGSPYCIVLPPPNVTGSLHMGHGFQVSIMDALVRYYRMRGYRVLWQGGTDHAGIATQMVVERKLLAEGKQGAEIPREELLSTLSAWKIHSEQCINSQLQRLGASIDFARNRFTLDAGFERAVKAVLVKLSEEKLLYRGKRLTNWDPHLLTAISDLEVSHTEEAGLLYYIRYPLLNAQGSVTLATTRPETLFGDAAIAVHPEDARYQALLGKDVKVPLANQTISIIADCEVEPDFGTGCVKVTPAHDFNDYKIGQRHQLPLINILTAEATLNETVPKRYQGMDCATARKAVLEDLKEQGNFVKQEPRMVSVPRGDRSGAIIEPYLTNQWFISMKPLAAKAIKAIETGEVKFFPENWKAICLQWLSNTEDWCISRQLWWGHRIPAWYTKAGQCFVGMNEATVRSQHNIDEATDLRQDQDVLDTWVSSALWPFVALGWPEQSKDLNIFYPTDVLVTGFDILFFWVARMLMLGLHFTKQVPFKTVYVTGLIRDHLGQKMSKSKGNVVDPLDMIEGIDLERLVTKRKHGLMQPQMADKIEELTRNQFPNGIDGLGADALRMTYYSLASPTRDIRFDMNRTVGYRNFCNKLWQVTRFVCNQFSTNRDDSLHDLETTSVFDLWILSRLQRVIDKAHQCFQQYRFDHLTQLLYDFVWHEYCDWYVELVKPYLRSEERVVRLGARNTLTSVLAAVIQLLHPLMPFITETLWSELQKSLSQKSSSLLYGQSYPIVNVDYLNAQAEEEVAWIQQVVRAIRRLRSEIKIPNHQLIALAYETQHPVIKQKLTNYRSEIERFVKGSIVQRVSIDDIKQGVKQQYTTIRMDEITWFVSFDNASCADGQIDRLYKEKGHLEKEISVLEKRISDGAFRLKAPLAVVEKTQLQLDMAKKKLADTIEKFLMYKQ